MLAPPPIEGVVDVVALEAYSAALSQYRKDRINARTRRSRAALSVAQREELKAKRRSRDAARYERDREKIVARQKRYYRKNRVKLLAQMNLNRRLNVARDRLYQAARRAAQRGLEFDIDFTDIVIPETCPVLGIPITYGKTTAGAPMDGNPSLDRFDNAKGYVKGNVRVISMRANRLKSNATLAEMEALIAYMRGEK